MLIKIFQKYFQTIVGVLTLTFFVFVSLAGCNNAAQLGANQKSSETPTPEISAEDKLAALIKRAEQGDAEAQYVFGWKYIDGDGVPKDAAKAVEWFQKAAAQGYARAQHKLGDAYFFGEGVPKDKAKAVEWYKKAANQGDVSAQSWLGLLYDTGFELNGPTDPKEATFWYEKAATQGDVRAQGALGVMYAEGEGVPKDAAKAVEWFQKAAAQDDADSQHNLGLKYVYGDGVPKDRVLAYAWINLAAANSHRMLFVEKGDLLEKILAANKAENIKIRDSLERLLTPEELTEAQLLSSNWKIGEVLRRKR